MTEDAKALRDFLEAGKGAPIAIEPAVVDGQAVGLALFRGAQAAWLDLSGLDEAAENVLAQFLADAAAPKIFHDAKATMHLLADRGLKLAGIHDDTLISAYLIPAGFRPRADDLVDVVQYHLKYAVPVHQAKKGELDLGADLAGPGLPSLPWPRPRPSTTSPPSWPPSWLKSTRTSLPPRWSCR